MQSTLTVANWKMYGNRKSWRELASGIVSGMSDIKTSVVLAVPAPAFADVGCFIGEYSKVSLAAQDIHPKDEGAFTGDVGAPMLKDFGVKFTLVGHSERRAGHQEKGLLLNEKIKQALKHNLCPIFCVGESLKQRNDYKTISVLDEQLEEGLNGVHIEKAEQLIIAYEPVWAISSSAGSLGREPSEEELADVFSHIRAFVNERFGLKLGEKIKLLYGGSVKPENTEKIMQTKHVSGVLVGGASLKAESFLAIATTVAKKQTN